MPPIALLLAQAATATAPSATHAAADASGISAQNPTFAVAVVAVLTTIFFAVDKIDAFVQRRRRQPTLDAQLERMASAITTLTGAVDDLKKDRDTRAGHATEIRLLERRCVELEKQAAELRDKADREAAANRKYMMETTREIFELMRKQAADSAAEIKGVTASMNKGFQDFALQIGQLTEAVKK